MAVVLSSPASILLHPSRSPLLAVPQFPPLSSSAASSSSASSSSDLHRTYSSRRIRFAPLPEPRHDDQCYINEDDDAQCSDESHPDISQDASDSDQSDDLALDTKHTIIDVHVPAPPVDPAPAPQSSSSVPPVSRAGKLLRSLPFFHRPTPSPHAPSSASHPRDASAPHPPSTTTPSSGSPVPVPGTRRPLHISTEDVRGSLPFFRRSANSPRGRSPPPPPTTSPGSTPPPSVFYRTTSRASVQSCPAAENKGDKEAQHGRRSSSLLPGAGGGRHSASTKMISSPLARPSTAPNGNAGGKRKHIRLLNGRVYGAKRRQGVFLPFACHFTHLTCSPPQRQPTCSSRQGTNPSSSSGAMAAWAQ